MLALININGNAIPVPQKPRLSSPCACSRHARTDLGKGLCLQLDIDSDRAVLYIIEHVIGGFENHSACKHQIDCALVAATATHPNGCVTVKTPDQKAMMPTRRGKLK